MKKALAALLMLCTLTGCSAGRSEMDRAMALRSKLLEGNGCTFDAEIEADYGDKLYGFTVSCQGSPEGDLTFSVVEPQSISGITGRISWDKGSLTFDGTALEFPLLADAQLAPVTAPWIFLKTLRSGYLTSVGTEGGQLRLSIDDSYRENALHLDIWLDETEVPVRCEILYGERKILSLQVKNFALL